MCVLGDLSHPLLRISTNKAAFIHSLYLTPTTCHTDKSEITFRWRCIFSKMDKVLSFWRKKSSNKTLLSPNIKYSLKLVEKRDISPDTKIFRLALPSEHHILGSPVGHHIYLSAMINGKFVPRPYTPITSDDDKGYVDLVVKIYERNANFPEGGLMSQHLDEMKIGDFIKVEGPSGDLAYLGLGKFSIRPDPLSAPEIVQVKMVSMIAGGTGITPMLQLIRKIVKNPTDDTKMMLLFANRTEKDILLRAELEDLVENHSDQLKIWYTLSIATESWEYDVGYVSEEMIKDRIFPPSSDNIVLISGPPAMIEFACIPSLAKLCYDQKNIFVY